MRPPEAKNLRWRDITLAKDRDGREIVVMFVQGKGKSRKLVAPKSVGEYLARVRELSKATTPDDSVFTIINGKACQISLQRHRASLARRGWVANGSEWYPTFNLLFPPHLRHFPA